jgi:branched-chain amino acid transport system permease protein
VPKIRGNVLGLVILTAVLAALPLALPEYHLIILTKIVIWMIVAVSYRLLATTGEISLGHVVVMGIGAYTSALLSRNLGFPFWVSAFMGGLVAASFAGATAYPLFRMKGFYFILGSFGIGEAIRLSWRRWVVPFGGQSGIRFIPHPVLGPFNFDTTFSYFYVTLGIAAACLAVMYLIDISRVGKALVAIRSQDSLCESLGINVFRHKALAYITASFFAGIAGALLAHYLGTLNPDLFSLAYMLFLVVLVIVGGLSTFWGPIIGVSTLYPIQEVLRIHFLEYMPMFYGIVLISMVFALPGGLESLPARIREWQTARKKKLLAVS